MDEIERKMRNISQNAIGISKIPPSLIDMADGERRYSVTPGNKLRLYLRFGSKLYYSEFTPVEESLNKWEDIG